MSSLHTCLACGHEGHDVAMTLVELHPSDQRMVEVMVPVTHRDGALETAQTVPERFISEPRCRDTKACADRVRALDPAEPPQPPAPVVDAKDDDQAWLL